MFAVENLFALFQRKKFGTESPTRMWRETPNKKPDSTK